jgi:hypothetical protein
MLREPSAGSRRLALDPRSKQREFLMDGLRPFWTSRPPYPRKVGGPARPFSGPPIYARTRFDG